MVEKEMMIAIKQFQKDKILLISIDGSKRYLVEKETLKKSGLDLGSICQVDIENYSPESFKMIKHKSGLHFEVLGKTLDSAVGRGTCGVLRKQNGSVFFESKIFGRVACVDDNITISKLDKSHPINVTILSEEFKVGENSVCHWGAIIDENSVVPSKVDKAIASIKHLIVQKEKNNNVVKNPQKEKEKSQKISEKIQKQCVGVVTKVEDSEENIKSYFCWLTDEHISSIVFDSAKRALHLQRGDFFRANFVKFKGCDKWKFVSFIERIEPLTIIYFHKDTIGLVVRIQNIRFANNEEFRANTEAYHPIVGNIIDPWKILNDSDSDGIEVKIVLHKFTGTYSWAVSKKVA